MPIDPLTIGMIMASLAGTGMQSMAAGKSARAKDRAAQAVLRQGVERGREFEKEGLALTRKAVEEERGMADLAAQKKGEALALMSKKDAIAPTSHLGAVQAAKRGQASESAAKVIGSEQGVGAMRRQHAKTLMPLSQIIENARRDWDVTGQEALSARSGASAGGGLMTIGEILKLAAMAGGTFGLPSSPSPYIEAGTLPTVV